MDGCGCDDIIDIVSTCSDSETIISETESEEELPSLQQLLREAITVRLRRSQRKKRKSQFIFNDNFIN